MLLVGATYFIQHRFFDTTTYYSQNGEVKTLTLPDGSFVRLNSNSSIHFNNYHWQTNRAVEIKGQAFFDIQKNKGKFDVVFDSGTIQVLGTKFDVFSHKEFTTIQCYEGKIKANINKSEHILTANMGVKFNGVTTQKTTFKNNIPNWNSNFTKFKNVSLKEVLTSLNLKYDVGYKVDNEQFFDKKFTGKYANNDLNLALEMILSPLSLTYNIKDSTIYISKK